MVQSIPVIYLIFYRGRLWHKTVLSWGPRTNRDSCTASAKSLDPVGIPQMWCLRHQPINLSPGYDSALRARRHRMHWSEAHCEMVSGIATKHWQFNFTLDNFLKQLNREIVIDQTVLFDTSMEQYEVQPLRVILDLIAMVMKGYSTFPKGLESYYQTQFSIISKTLVLEWGSYPSTEMQTVFSTVPVDWVYTNCAISCLIYSV